MENSILTYETAKCLLLEDKLFLIKNSLIFSKDIKDSLYAFKCIWEEDIDKELIYSTQPVSLMIKDTLMDKNHKVFPNITDNEIFNKLYEYYFKPINTAFMSRDTDDSLNEYMTSITYSWRNVNEYVLKLDDDSKFSILHFTFDKILRQYVKAYDIRTKLEFSYKQLQTKSNGYDLFTNNMLYNLVDIMTRCALRKKIIPYIAAVYFFIMIIDGDKSERYTKYVNLFSDYGKSFDDPEHPTDVESFLNSLIIDDTLNIVELMNRIDSDDITLFDMFTTTRFNSNLSLLKESVFDVNDRYCIYSDTGIQNKSKDELVAAIKYIDADYIKEYIGNRFPSFKLPENVFNPTFLDICHYNNFKYALYKEYDENKNEIDSRILVEINGVGYIIFSIFDSQDSIYGISIDAGENDSRDIIKIKIPKNIHTIKAGECLWQ